MRINGSHKFIMDRELTHKHSGCAPESVCVVCGQAAMVGMYGAHIMVQENTTIELEEFTGSAPTTLRYHRPMSGLVSMCMCV